MKEFNKKDIEIKYKLPVASTALLDSPRFLEKSGRVCSLAYEYENLDDDNITTSEISFLGVESYRCTYYNAIDIEKISTAYGRLVDFGKSSWLRKIFSNLVEYEKEIHLVHLGIYFDDGPLYEFICVDFKVEESQKSQNIYL